MSLTQLAAGQVFKTLALRKIITKTLTCLITCGVTSTEKGGYLFAGTPALQSFFKFRQPRHLVKEGIVLLTDLGLAYLGCRLMGPSDYAPFPSAMHMLFYHLDISVALPEVLRSKIPGTIQVTNDEYRNFAANENVTIKQSLLLTIMSPAVKSLVGFLVDKATGNTPYRVAPMMIASLYDAAGSAVLYHVQGLLMRKLQHKFDLSSTAHCALSMVSGMVMFGGFTVLTSSVTSAFVAPFLERLQTNGETGTTPENPFPLLSQEGVDKFDAVPAMTLYSIQQIAQSVVSDPSIDNSTRIHALMLGRQMSSYMRYACSRKHRVRKGPIKCGEPVPAPSDAGPCMLCGEPIVKMQKVTQVAPCGHPAHIKCVDESKIDMCLYCICPLDNPEDEEQVAKMQEAGLEYVQKMMESWMQQPLLPPELVSAEFGDAAHFAHTYHGIPICALRFHPAYDRPTCGGVLPMLLSVLFMFDIEAIETNLMLRVPCV